MQANTAHSDRASGGPVWPRIILTPPLKGSKSPRARIPEGLSLYISRLVPRILKQTYHLSTNYELVKVSTYRMHVQKRMVRWVTIFHHYNFPLLHY